MKFIHSVCVAGIILAGSGTISTFAALPPQGPVQVPNTFAAGTPARASEVNENFAALANGINNNASRVDDNAAAIDGLSASLELVRTVAKSGAGFRNVADALASITDAAADRPYRVDVAPGIYDEATALTVPSFVRLAGSGIGVTVIRRPAAGTSQSSENAVITLEDGAQLCDLSVRNPGSGSAFSLGVLGFALGSSTRVERVESVVDGAGGTAHFAFLFQDSDLAVYDSIGQASGATIANAGIGSGNTTGQLSKLRIERCRFAGDEGSVGFGVQVANTDAEILECDLFGSKHALLAQGTGAVEVRSSNLRSLQEVMSQSGTATLQLATTQLTGSNPIGIPSNLRYVHCYKANFTAIVNGQGSTTQ